MFVLVLKLFFLCCSTDLVCDDFFVFALTSRLVASLGDRVKINSCSRVCSLLSRSVSLSLVGQHFMTSQILEMSSIWFVVCTERPANYMFYKAL